MKIQIVTLTGADADTDKQALFDLSLKYPFVEWAILFHQQKAGTARYPDWTWVSELISKKLRFIKDSLVTGVSPDNDIFESCPIKLSAHLCGKWVSDLVKGVSCFWETMGGMNIGFNRFQLNLAALGLVKAIASQPLIEKVKSLSRPVLIGGNYEAITPAPALFRDIGAHPLFDASGGRGIATKEWLEPWADEAGPLFCGYAGGLGPETLESELHRISEVVGDATIWIDMESRIRTKDVLDLKKCEAVLEICKAWVS